MDFSNQLDSLMKPFIKAFGKCEKTILSKTDHKRMETILISLHKDIYTSNDLVLNAGCFKSSVVNIQTDYKGVKRPEDYSKSRYFPAVIQNYIKENELYQLIFSCGNVGGREINIHFTLFSEEELSKLALYVQHVRLMYVWLNICAKYANTECSNVLDIYVYPTPFTKNLPGSTASVLGPEHVNTAFTFACAPHGELIIFREEEWFKVFIHETFHAYGLDFARSEVSEFKLKIKSLFPINSDFDLYEAYTETWARIVNCAFCSFNALENDKKRDKNAFLVNFNFCIELERLFAIYQCTKVLSFMGLHYNDISDKKSNYLRDKLYKENTHVFAYYIMTAIFLNDYEGFLLWCKKNNKVLLKFDLTPENFASFAEYIESVYDCVTFLSGIDYMGKMNKQVNRDKNNKLLINTTRMSIVQ
jgi:hypothetical protein